MKICPPPKGFRDYGGRNTVDIFWKKIEQISELRRFGI